MTKRMVHSPLKASLTLVLCGAILAGVSFAAELPKEVIPIGKAAGIKMLAEGAIVVKLSQSQGEPLAGEKAGIQEGDVIICVDGKTILSNEDLEAALNLCDGKAVSVTLLRGGKELSLSAQPQKSIEDDSYKLGVWVRDSMAGIGTITFIDPETMTFGALGHGINDSDSGLLMHLTQGELIRSDVNQVIKGQKGAAGELGGKFFHETVYGAIEKNTNVGIFGKISTLPQIKDARKYPVATKNEVKTGKAYVLSNVRGGEVERFEIEILRVLHDGDKTKRDFMIGVCDPRLLDITGGIVQGMSGSPILQEGKVIGAVTHVLVNDPRRGYGVSIEQMLEENSVKTTSLTAA